MGNGHSIFKNYYYITRVTNLNLPLVPFVHLIIGYNNMPANGMNHSVHQQSSGPQNLVLDVLDLALNQTFKLTIPKFNYQSNFMNNIGTQHGYSCFSFIDPTLGITVVNIKELPVLLKMRVISIKKSSNTKLEVNDNILGIEGEYCLNEQNLIERIKGDGNVRLLAIRNGEVIAVDVENSEIGCDVGMGDPYSIKAEEIYMKGYTGMIRKGLMVHNTYNHLNTLGDESSDRSLSNLESSENMKAANEKICDNDEQQHEAIPSMDNGQENVAVQEQPEMQMPSNLSENAAQPMGNSQIDQQSGSAAQPMGNSQADQQSGGTFQSTENSMFNQQSGGAFQSMGNSMFNQQSGSGLQTSWVPLSSQQSWGTTQPMGGHMMNHHAWNTAQPVGNPFSGWFSWGSSEPAKDSASPEQKAEDKSQTKKEVSKKSDEKKNENSSTKNSK